MISRRGFLGGLAAALAAPYVVRSGVLMPLRGVILPLYNRSIWQIEWGERVMYGVYGRSPGMDILPELRMINRATANYLEEMRAQST